LEEERRPSFFSIPRTKSSNEEKVLNDLKCRLKVLLDRKGQKNQSINSENYDKGSNVQEKKETCKFLKFGKCRHGLSGKEPDQEKVCSYNHPPVCREHEKWGLCYDNRCKDVHLKSCREYMNNQYCTYGDNCKFWHPTGEIPTESRVFHGRNHSYLRQQSNQMHGPFLDLNQGQSSQGTLLELMEGHKERQKEISEIERRLEQIVIQNKQLLNSQRLSTATYIVSAAGMSDGESDNDEVFDRESDSDELFDRFEKLKTTMLCNALCPNPRPNSPWGSRA
jgi:hypothetical protein